MVGIVIASHGEFCVGLKRSCEMIAGEIENCRSVPLTPQDTPEEYCERLEKAVHEVEQGEGVLVLSDLQGGTPFNCSLMLCKNCNIQIVVGMNLPMLLVLALGRNEHTTIDELAIMAKQEGKECINIIKYE